jgi:hypothetical protein
MPSVTDIGITIPLGHTDKVIKCSRALPLVPLGWVRTKASLSFDLQFLAYSRSGDPARVAE